MARPVSKPAIVVVGSSNTDLVLSCARLPRPGETLLGGEFTRSLGGKGANQAVAAARAGAKVAFVGARGGDEFGARALAALRREGVDVRHFSVKGGWTSGVALILLGGPSRENLIAVARSANDGLTPEDVGQAEGKFRRARAVVAQLEIPPRTVLAAARLARAHGVPFILNPAPAAKVPAALLKLVDTITPNEHEAATLTGSKDLAEAGRILLRRGCRRVVITCGSRGALLVDGEGVREFAAPKVRPRDTVGAGDCFTGWLAVGIAEGLPIAIAITRAIEAASLSVTRVGAQDGMPKRREVEKLRPGRRPANPGRAD